MIRGDISLYCEEGLWESEEPVLSEVEWILERAAK